MIPYDTRSPFVSVWGQVFGYLWSCSSQCLNSSWSWSWPFEESSDRGWLLVSTESCPLSWWSACLYQYSTSYLFPLVYCRSGRWRTLPRVCSSVVHLAWSRPSSLLMSWRRRCVVDSWSSSNPLPRPHSFASKTYRSRWQTHLPLCHEAYYPWWSWLLLVAFRLQSLLGCWPHHSSSSTHWKKHLGSRCRNRSRGGGTCGSL